MSAPWWAGLPPAQATVDCRGERHTLRWAAGALTTTDHPDGARERTLAALGGEPYPCLRLADAWARHADDIAVLVRASRGPGDPLASPDHGGLPRSSRMPMVYASRGTAVPRAAARPGRAPRGWTSYSPLGARGPGVPGDEFAELLLLGGALPERLVATVVAAHQARAGDTIPAALHAAVYGRAVQAVRGWLGEPDLAVDVDVGPPDAAARAGRDGEGVRLALPISWLSTVWARDLAVVAGRFCLAATAGGSRWTLTTVAPDFDAPVTIEMTLPS